MRLTKMTSNMFDIKSEIHVEKDLQKKFSLKTLNNKSYKQIEYKFLNKIKGWFEFQEELKWLNIIVIFILHAVALYGIVIIGLCSNIITFIWGNFLGALQAFGITAGMHRLWTHRAYKAKWPLRLTLMLFYCMAGQNRPIQWVRDHRVHHKFTDTDADPHNSTRGFFFSHVGWLMMRKHPEVIRKGREIDINDVLKDPIFIFGEKYFIILKIILCLIMPIVIPVYMWNETWFRSIILLGACRYAVGLNCAWLVNSLAHLGTSKPYDAHINPSETRLVSFLTYGEGWHNYHHVFPWDYKAAELGNYELNITTLVLDICAKFGWAYDLKQPSKALVKSIVIQRGDGSHNIWGAEPHPDNNIKQ